MTNLVNTLPESTFGDVITTTNNGQGLPAETPVPIQDGLGNDSPMSMSQTVVNFTRTGGSEFQLDGIPLTVPATLLNNTGLEATLQTVDNAYHTIVSLEIPTFVVGVPKGLVITATIAATTNGPTFSGACTPTPVTAFAMQFDVSAAHLAGTPTITFNDSTAGVAARWAINAGNLEIEVRGTVAPQTINWTVGYQYFVF